MAWFSNRVPAMQLGRAESCRVDVALIQQAVSIMHDAASTRDLSGRRGGGCHRTHQTQKRNYVQAEAETRVVSGNS